MKIVKRLKIIGITSSKYMIDNNYSEMDSYANVYRFTPMQLLSNLHDRHGRLMEMYKYGHVQKVEYLKIFRKLKSGIWIKSNIKLDHLRIRTRDKIFISFKDGRKRMGCRYIF